jgi:hypothetical protein
MGRNHIRVDVFHEMLPRKAQAVLNWVSITSLAVFALFIDYVALKVVADTLEYRSTAQTPWATPLIYPQMVWYAGLVIFSLVAVGYAARATFLLFSGRTSDVLHEFQPKSAKEELKEELDDLAQRHAAQERTNEPDLRHHRLLRDAGDDADRHADRRFDGGHRHRRRPRGLRRPLPRLDRPGGLGRAERLRCSHCHPLSRAAG